MSTDLPDAITAIQNRLAAVTRDVHRAELNHDVAKARAAEIRQQLHREFGVNGLDEARAWLADAETELRQLITDLDAALDTATAPTQPPTAGAAP